MGKRRTADGRRHQQDATLNGRLPVETQRLLCRQEVLRQDIKLLMLVSLEL